MIRPGTLKRIRMSPTDAVRTAVNEVKKAVIPTSVTGVDGKTVYSSVAAMEGKDKKQVPTICQIRTTGCCGLREIVDMSSCDSPQEVLAIAAKFFGGVANYPYPGFTTCMGEHGHRQPFLLFTGITKIGERKANHVTKFNKETKQTVTVLDTEYWQKFIDYIKKNELGEVWEGPRRENDCYGNEVGVFVWTPNWPNFTKWAKEKITVKTTPPALPGGYPTTETIVTE